MAEDKENSIEAITRGIFDKLKKIEIPEFPPWRNDRLSCLSISEMMETIVQQHSYCNFNLPLADSQANSQYQEAIWKMKVDYIVAANIGEDEGTKDLESTEVALAKKNYLKNIKPIEQVSVNLLMGIQHLEAINQESDEDRGLLDVEVCIQDTHALLMDKILERKKLGNFSTDVRVAEYKGEVHEYPTYSSQDDAYREVQRKVDLYNDTINYIKSCQLEAVEEFAMYFKCAAWILYNFVALHPFADGNGRMCRLLASYCLYLVCPFPCPIYNIYAPSKREDYLDAVVLAQKSDGEDLASLVALLVECCWAGYNHLLMSLHAKPV